MENCPSQDEYDFCSKPNWSPSEEDVFVDVLVEEFINILREEMDTLIAQILLKLSLIPDEAWVRVAKRFNERTGKSYAKMELKQKLERLCQRFPYVQPHFEQGGFGWDFPRRTFDSGDPMSAGYIRVKPEYGCGMEEDLRETCTRRTAPKERANDAGTCRSGDNNVSCPVENARNSKGSSGSVPCAEENVKNSNGCNDKVSCLEENVKNLDRYDNVSCPGKNQNSNGCTRASSPGENVQNSSEWDNNALGPGENVKIFCECNTASCPGKNQNSDGCTRASSPGENVKNFSERDVASCPGENVKKTNGSYSVFSCPGMNQNSSRCNRDSSPGENVQNSSERDNNASGPGGNVNNFSERDTASCPEENVKKSNGSNGGVSCPGKNQNSDGCTRALSPGENVQNSSQWDSNASGPGENVKKFSQRDTASCPEENAKTSTRCESYVSGREENAKDSKGCNKRPFADPASSSPNKRNKSRFEYSRADTTSGINAPSGSRRTKIPDIDESYSTACCLKILNGMKGVDRHLHDAAVDF